MLRFRMRLPRVDREMMRDFWGMSIINMGTGRPSQGDNFMPPPAKTIRRPSIPKFQGRTWHDDNVSENARFLMAK